MSDNKQTNGLISIIMPPLHGPGMACRCLDALLKQHCGRLEILVPADGSCCRRHRNDSRVKFAGSKPEALPSRLQMLRKGLESAAGEITVFADPRYLPAGDDWLLQLTEPLKEPDVGAVTGRIQPNRSPGGNFPQLLSRALDSSLAHHGRRRESVDLLTLKCEAFRSGLLKELVGGEDISVPPDAEAVELSIRIRMSDHKIIYQPLASVVRREDTDSAASAPRNILTAGMRFGEADAYLGRTWGIDRGGGRLFMAAVLSLLPVPLAFFSVPYATIAAGLLFGWGWFFGFRIPLIPWEWPAALANLGVFIALILAVRNRWAPSIFPPLEFHPAIIRQWLFVISMPVSYMLITLAAGFRAALRGVCGLRSLVFFPLLAVLASLWHLLAGVGYAREIFLPRYKQER